VSGLKVRRGGISLILGRTKVYGLWSIFEKNGLHYAEPIIIRGRVTTTKSILAWGETNTVSSSCRGSLVVVIELESVSSILVVGLRVTSSLDYAASDEPFNVHAFQLGAFTSKMR
jgi:hypothetical protein